MLSLKFVCVRLSPYLDLALDTRLTSTLHPGIQASLIQICPIFLSTLLSINRQTLSLYDASYALLITSSPLTVYLAVASVCDPFGFKTDLYKRIKSYRRTTRILGALVLFLWLGLSMTLTLSDRRLRIARIVVVWVSRIRCGMFPGTFRTRILEVNLRDLVFFLHSHWRSGYVYSGGGTR
jgi:hypothetical protein